MRILVVFSQLPESIHFIEFDANPEIAEFLESCNGKYIGGVTTGEEVSRQMDDFFYEEDGRLKHEDKIVQTPLKNRSYELIVECGFLM